MITQVNCRANSSGQFEELERLTVNSDRAVKVLCLCELAWGGTITDLTGTRVEIKTEAMPGVRDRTLFEGPENEMAPVVRAAAMATVIRSECREQIAESTARALDQLPTSMRGVPRHIVLFAPMFLGRAPAIAGLLAAAEIQEKEEVESVKGLSPTQVWVAWRLQKECGDFVRTFCEAAECARSAARAGIDDTQVTECEDVAEREHLSFGQVFLAARTLTGYKLAMKDIPAILAMAKETGKSIEEIAAQLR